MTELLEEFILLKLSLKKKSIDNIFLCFHKFPIISNISPENITHALLKHHKYVS